MQRKEGFNQKMQENKPVLELKNTEKKMCQKSKLKKQNSQCTLLQGDCFISHKVTETNKYLKIYISGFKSLAFTYGWRNAFPYQFKLSFFAAKLKCKK